MARRTGDAIPTELQRLILQDLAHASRDPDRWGIDPATAAEIADRIHEQRGIRPWERKPVSEAESVAAALGRMAQPLHGWVERLGRASNGSRCWTITDAGLAALRGASVSAPEETDRDG